MLDTNVMPPQTMRYTAILEFTTDADDDGARMCRVYHRNGHLDAWTWLPETGNDRAPRVGEVTTLELYGHGTEFVVLGFEAQSNLSIAHALSEHACPIPGVVAQTSELIDGLKSAALHRFAMDAFLHRDALSRYWESPASRYHHHAYAGGLAEHSLEVATMIASTENVLPDDRELGIVFALLHDYGKLWCYGPNRSVCDSSKHERIGYDALREPLDRLVAADPETGAKMTELLGGPRAPRDTVYPLSIGRIVRAFDQMSCEKTRRTVH